MDTPSSILLKTSVIFINIAIFLVGKFNCSFLKISSAFDFEISFQVPLNTSWGLYEVHIIWIILIQAPQKSVLRYHRRSMIRYSGVPLPDGHSQIRHGAVKRPSGRRISLLKTFSLIHALLDVLRNVIMNESLRLHLKRIFYWWLSLTKIHLLTTRWRPDRLVYGWISRDLLIGVDFRESQFKSFLGYFSRVMKGSRSFFFWVTY